MLWMSSCDFSESGNHSPRSPACLSERQRPSRKATTKKWGQEPRKTVTSRAGSKPIPFSPNPTSKSHRRKRPPYGDRSQLPQKPGFAIFNPPCAAVKPPGPETRKILFTLRGGIGEAQSTLEAVKAWQQAVSPPATLSTGGVKTKSARPKRWPAASRPKLPNLCQELLGGGKFNTGIHTVAAENQIGELRSNLRLLQFCLGLGKLDIEANHVFLSWPATTPSPLRRSARRTGGASDTAFSDRAPTCGRPGCGFRRRYRGREGCNDVPPLPAEPTRPGCCRR